MTLEEKLLQLLSYKPNGVPRLGIPNLEAGEALHGVVTRGATVFPQAIALGSTWDPVLVERVSTVIAAEARAVGIAQVFSPMLGLARDPRWGRIEESYGEDPYLVGEIGVAYVNGLQGRGQERYGPDRVIATAKHFVADGEPFAGANGEDHEFSQRELREIYMRPFEAVIRRAGIGSIMPAHHAIDGVPCHMNHWLLDEVARHDWSFAGFVTSDMGDIPKLAGGHRMVRSREDAAVAALDAGVDMELVGDVYMKELPSAIRQGKISQAVVDRSVRRVLTAKVHLLGLGQPDAAAAGPSAGQTKQEILAYQGNEDIWAKLIAQGKFNTPESARRPDWEQVLKAPAHDALALEAAQKAIVLLKNSGGLLPLNRAGLRKILVTGPLADEVNLGGYSSGQPKFYVKLTDGLRTLLGPGIEVAYAPGCSLEDAGTALQPAAVSQAATADVIVAVVGHSRKYLGENLDRDSLGLIGGQLALVQAMQATGKPVVVVFQDGAPISEPWIAEHIPAIVESWYLGQAAGTALAQALLGTINPGGKLPVSVAHDVGQIPCYYDHPQFHGPRHYQGAKFGDNLYAFGHGLSYTTFDFGRLNVVPGGPGSNVLATVTVTVTNRGSRAGDEVPQLYVRQDYTSLKRPALELRGFQRITLEPGQSKEVSFALGFDDLKFWKTDHWVTEPGEINLLVGASSADIRQRGTFTLTAGRSQGPSEL